VDLDELVSEMKRSPISLFYGAGVTVTCGGPSWDELFTSVKDRFPGSKADDFFEYMEDTIGFDNAKRAEVEAFIRQRLAGISAQDDQRYLFSIPWRAVLTTNYDSLPESANVTLDGRRQIMTISDPSEHIDQRREDHLYCFKLLGDCRYSFPQAGWMSISTSDLFATSEHRSRFFERFRILASSGHIVYLGYSFNDNLVFRLLSHMKTSLRIFPWRGFAVIPSEPEPDVLKKMESVGITWIKGTLQDFVTSSKKVFGDVPGSAPVETGFVTVHGQAIELDRSILANIWNKFSILRDELLMQTSETPTDFLSGRCRTFFPYVLNWDYVRKTKLLWANPNTRVSIPPNLSKCIERIAIEDLRENAFVALVGIAGSGKTIAINRLAFEWRQKGNPVIFVHPEVSAIDTDALNGVIDEIREKYLNKVQERKIQKPPPLRWLILADDCGHLLSDLRTLRNYLLATGRPSDLVLVTRESETPVERLKDFGLDAIYRLDDTIDTTERDKFLAHFRRFGVMDADIVNKNLQDPEVNSSFFGLVYSSIHQSQKTIKKLLEEEYDGLDSDAKKIYRITSLIQSHRLRILRSLIMRSEIIDPDWLNSELRKGRLSGVLQLSDYGRSLITPNRFVAEAICDVAFRTSEERKLALSNVISAVTCEDFAEMEFLQNLLNGSIELDVGPKYSVGQKIDLFRRGVDRVRSRPLLIHLGRLETNAQRFSDARKTLNQAYEAHVEGFDERIEHVKDAEGRLDLAIAESEFHSGRHDSAWKYLDEAEEKFVQAKINPRVTPHPYEGLGRTYLEKSRIAKEEGIKWDFVLAAMQECNYVERYLGETSEIFLLKKEIENNLDSLRFSESDIVRIGTRIGKANAYAYLAENEAARGDLRKAMEYVEKGLKLNGMSIWLMRLRVSLLRKLFPDNHLEIMKILDDYAAVSNEQYDIELSFELAKEIYMSGRVRESRSLFRELYGKARNHPRRLIIRDFEDRWREAGKPKRLTGTIIIVPTEDRYGSIETTFPTIHRDTIVVRKKDLQFKDPKVGDRVDYEMVFNMFGPEASRVRRR